MKSKQMQLNRSVMLFAWLAVAAVCGPARAAEPTSRPAGGIACYGHTALEYRRQDKPALRVEFGEPIVVAVASEPLKWGYFQFPGLTRWADGRLCVSWSMAEDSALAYGSVSSMALSEDEGKSWKPYKGPWGVCGVLLPNGDRIAVLTPKSRKVSELNLPEPVGTVPHTYLKEQQPVYRLADLPEKLRAVYIKRLPAGSDKWQLDLARLEDPQALRYSTQGVFPVVWWGNIHVLPDGSLLSGIYPGYRILDDGQVDPKCHVFFYRSTDNGHSWQVQGRLLYEPDLQADPKGAARGGFTEPMFDLMPDGLCVCVARTTDGRGPGPLYVSRSRDFGKTWSRPEAITSNGVLPRILHLENGVQVLSAGRPGVQVRFCTDGQGKTWSDPFEMLPYENGDEGGSCGYTSVLPTGPDRFLIDYSNFRYVNDEGRPRKAILVREVVVTPLK